MIIAEGRNGPYNNGDFTVITTCACDSAYSSIATSLYFSEDFQDVIWMTEGIMKMGDTDWTITKGLTRCGI
ncbi:hypothetical protein F0562_028515 [Nyssa sinensis]|uniref:Uncharacterized protein n=1 Tax=Nyssa sinensis TaxID=561372 RepID=A0A5J5B2L8_9ASTE|nr:hypothetical protein F0562_028515 [Nyssa sinensis]